MNKKEEKEIRENWVRSLPEKLAGLVGPDLEEDDKYPWWGEDDVIIDLWVEDTGLDLSVLMEDAKFKYAFSNDEADELGYESPEISYNINTIAEKLKLGWCMESHGYDGLCLADDNGDDERPEVTKA